MRDIARRVLRRAGDRDGPVPRQRFDAARIDRARAGFAIADRVLHDTLDDHWSGGADTAELILALDHHRRSYEAYLRTLYACLRRR